MAARKATGRRVQDDLSVLACRVALLSDEIAAPVAVANDGHRRGVEQPDLVLLGQSRTSPEIARCSSRIPVLGCLWHNQHHTRRPVKADR